MDEEYDEETIEEDDVINSKHLLSVKSVEKLSPTEYKIYFINQTHTIGCVLSDRISGHENIMVCNYKSIPLSKEETWYIFIKKYTTESNIKVIVQWAIKSIVTDLHNLKTAIQTQSSQIVQLSEPM
jgi:DNA-directed RNA polymerase subunit L